MKTAILYGASGLVGSNILQVLLGSNNHEKVIVVVRKDLGIYHPKLVTITCNFVSFESLVQDLKVNEVYIALGTTRKKTPDDATYYQIDHDYPLLAAKLAKDSGAQSVFFISSIGANEQSSFFFTKTKGSTERDIISLNFEHTYIFRPSMILGNRKEHRATERAAQKTWSLINPFLLGRMKRYKAIEASTFADAIVNAANKPTEKIKICYWSEIDALQKL